ncbi:hypothetical protein HMPREF1640_08035 [Prevotella sp. S7-1-8]|uniref:hypothetical protein n=1 Tax=Prevotella sp. S7-1-8 TaxID=1284775 RepID=UPI00050FF197|nr:hypothetical protein [Prevotella sp. S7-1-8]KGF17039.1 hypothetical protein HMPREF1640_08035 [Prevotella sp. S7-1-8]
MKKNSQNNRVKYIAPRIYVISLCRETSILAASPNDPYVKPENQVDEFQQGDSEDIQFDEDNE